MRNQRQKLERIDIDELFSSPVNRGMLSFLERPPEEAQARLREKQKVDAADATRIYPGGNLPSGLVPSPHQDVAISSREPIVNSQESVESLPPPVALSPLMNPRGTPLSSESTETATESCPAPAQQDQNKDGFKSPLLDQVSDNQSANQTYAVGKLPPDLTDTEGNLHTGEIDYVIEKDDNYDTHPVGELPSGELIKSASNQELTQGVTQPVGNFFALPKLSRLSTKESRTAAEGQGVIHPRGKSARDVNRKSYSLRSAVILAPESEETASGISGIATIDGSVVGRRQKVRRAIVAQDGHSSGEQLLYQTMWNAASVETLDTRLISIGYSGMSALCKLERSNCKKNAQGLIQKLAIEIAEPHQSTSSTGTTYRLFSYKEILRRREAAGLIWVIRTSGVRFVKPEGDSPSGPGGESRPRGEGNLPLAWVGNSPSGAGGDLHTAPVGKSPTHLERRKTGRKSISQPSSENIDNLCRFARSQVPAFDDDACAVLWKKCREVAPDCTVEEVIHSFELKLRQLFNERVRYVGNPVGLMIWSVPKMFEGPDALYLQRRRARADENARAAEAVSQFEQNRAHWQVLLDDPSTPEEDKKFYRKLLGHTNH